MFDLEQSIADWKKSLRRSPALEDAHAAELEQCLRDETADLVETGSSPEEAFRRAVAAMGNPQAADAEFHKVRASRRSGRPPWQPPPFVPALVWNYVRVAARKIRRQKGYSAINVAGLAVGLACCFLMTLWVRDERSFDRFHKNGDSIHRVIMDIETGPNACSPTPLGPAALSEWPEVLDFCRFRGSQNLGIWIGETVVYDDAIGIADPSILTMFTFPLLKGDPKTALTEPRSIVVSEEMARKYFGDEDPMGKILRLTDERVAHTVTGVLRPVPENSHLRFDALIPIVNLSTIARTDFNDWNDRSFLVNYIRLAPRTRVEETAREMSEWVRGKLQKSDLGLRLQPLKDIHLKSNFNWDWVNYAQGNAATLTTFSLAAAAVLLLACINFMNLATARSMSRAKEVGLRKVTGARRSDLILQFLGESVLLSLSGLVLALVLVGLSLPLFNNLSGKHLTTARLAEPGLVPALLGIVLLAGLVAGSYPALFLSSFQPASVFRETGHSGGRRQMAIRKGLVVFQFALTVFLIIGIVVVDKQLTFIRAKNLGMDPRQVLTIRTRIPFETLKSAFLANPRVLTITQSMTPGGEFAGPTAVTWEGKDPENAVHFYRASIDANFLEVFRVEMKEGRFFSENLASDRTEAVVVNETAARNIGGGSVLGKRLTCRVINQEGRYAELPMTVIGVVRDFHHFSLHRSIDPMVFTYTGAQWPSINIRINPEDVAGTLAFLEKTAKALAPNDLFSATFLDDKINGYYDSERRFKAILGLFAALALFTACLGLFGLASFMAERKTKEIGIRKVLGASVRGLAASQIREFAIGVLFANALAWPAAYFAVGKWLQSFAYRIHPGVGPAALAAAFSLAVALFSVGYKAVQAARANPIEALKYE